MYEARSFVKGWEEKGILGLGEYKRFQTAVLGKSEDSGKLCDRKSAGRFERLGHGSRSMSGDWPGLN